MWRHVERAHVGHERGWVIALVTAQGEATNSRRTAHDHLFGRLALGDAGRFVAVAATMSPLRFSISAWPKKLSLASLPCPLR
jgi:hypothetical protein